VDISKFREDIDIPKVINLIIWALEGFGNQEQARAKVIAVDQLDYEHILMELDAYIEIFKKSFYK